MELHVCQKLSCDLKDDARKSKELRKFLLLPKVLENNINNDENNKISENKMCFACLC